MKLPRIPEIPDLAALLTILSDPQANFAHVTKLQAVHDEVNKKLEAVENLDSINAMKTSAQARLDEAMDLRAQANVILALAKKEVEDITKAAKGEAARLQEEAAAQLKAANQKQTECALLREQLNKKLEEVKAEQGELRSEITRYIDQSREVAKLRDELRAKMVKLNEVMA